MVQQLFSDLQNIKDRLRYLEGQLRRLAIGGVILPGSNQGTATVPTAIDGAIIRGNATPGWERLVASVPAANVRNILGLDNGDIRPSWKVGLDATAPEDVIVEDPSGSPGTSLVMAHRDHQHGLSTAETDTSMRLAPDGAGGVEWSTGGSGGGGPSVIPFGSNPIDGEVFSPV